MRILLTGATGFVGSHIADSLLKNDYEVTILKRQKSSLVNCGTFFKQVHVISIDDFDWISDVYKMKPDVIIHAAWNGITSETRDDWESQLSNIKFTNELLYIAEYCQVKKFIALGSQAEYGQYSGIVTEENIVNPINKYGFLKVTIAAQIRSFCELRNINWYWLRVFSVFGERESLNWLFPSVIFKMINGSEGMDLTLCEQKYAYLYVKDLAKATTNICMMQGNSGIYNISSSNAVELRYLLSIIKEKVNPNFRLNFGALSYRDNQAMHIQGDSTKFIKEFGVFEEHSFEKVIDDVINYYRILQ